MSRKTSLVAVLVHAALFAVVLYVMKKKYIEGMEDEDEDQLEEEFKAPAPARRGGGATSGNSGFNSFLSSIGNFFRR